jgi:hypothetical protein
MLRFVWDLIKHLMFYTHTQALIDEFEELLKELHEKGFADDETAQRAKDVVLKQQVCMCVCVCV